MGHKIIKLVIGGASVLIAIAFGLAFIFGTSLGSSANNMMFSSNLPTYLTGSDGNESQEGIHTIQTNVTEGTGMLEADRAKAKADTVVQVTFTPGDGYVIKDWQTTPELTLTLVDETRHIYEFTMPDADVTITAQYERDAALWHEVSGYALNGGLKYSPKTAMAGTTITLTYYSELFTKPKANWSSTPQVTIDDPWEINAEGKGTATFVMPDENVDISVYFTEGAEPESYAVELVQPSHGTISASASSAQAGQEVTLTYTPAEGYQVTRWTATPDALAITSTSATTAKFTMPAQSVSVSAEVAIAQYSVNLPDTPEPPLVTVTSSTSTAEEGQLVTITATPANGYCVSVILVTNAETSETVFDSGLLHSEVTCTGTFTMPAADVNVAVAVQNLDDFKVKYNVQLQQNTGGSIASDVDEGVEGTLVTITASPDEGYLVRSIQVEALGAPSWTFGSDEFMSTQPQTYSFEIPSENVRVSAIFEPVISNYTLTILEPEGDGQVSASVENTVPEGQEVTLTYTASSGSQFKEWQTTPSDLAITNNPDGQTATFTMPSADVTVKGIFEPVPASSYTLELLDSEGGAVATLAGTSVPAGQQVTLIYTPSIGHQLKEWQTTPSDLAIANNPGGNTATFTMPAANVTVRGVFEAVASNYTLTLLDPEGTGQVSASTGATVAAGQQVTLTYTPGNGYYLKEWQTTPSDLVITNNADNKTSTFTMPESDVTVKGVFAKDEQAFYNVVAFGTGASGKVRFSPTRAAAGTLVTITATPLETNVYVSSWSISPAGIPLSLNSDKTVATFSMPASDVTVTATFAILQDPQTKRFIDVDSTIAHEDDINWLADTGISEGWLNKDGTRSFRPYDSVARADMAAFLYRLAQRWGLVDQWTPTAKQQGAFADVNASTPHANEIWWLASTGISEGWLESNGTKTFRPYDFVKRQDMAAFLYRLAAKAGKGSATQEQYKTMFSDVSATDSYNHHDEIWWLASNKVSEGWTVDNRKEFRGMENVARADMAAFLHRLDSL